MYKGYGLLEFVGVVGVVGILIPIFRTGGLMLHVLAGFLAYCCNGSICSQCMYANVGLGLKCNLSCRFGQL